MASVHTLYKQGTEVMPPKHLSLFTLLSSYAKQYKDKEALVFINIDENKKETYTYGQLLHICQALFLTLQEKYHIQSGDAIALHMENTPEILFFHIACWLHGVITVPLDLKRDDLERKIYKITETNCKLIVCKEQTEEVIHMVNNVSNLKCFQVSLDMCNELLQRPVETSKEEQIHNTSLILFTSGTTALPKGVELSLSNILLNADGISHWLKITNEDRFHIVLPLHHINSTTMSFATLLSGGTIILSSRYSKSQFWKLMAEYQATLCSIVPTICYDLLSEQSSFETYHKQISRNLRIQIGSAPVQPVDVEKFYRMTHIRLVQGYGSTETALRVTGVDALNMTEEEYLSIISSNSIGSELSWNNVEVIKEDGSFAKEHEEGEICIRGPVLTKGYLHNEKANSESFIDGWFHSGDVGHYKMHGGIKLFYTTGRKKEIIIKGGINISPLTVENAILKQFDDISLCHVVGMPDRRFGEEICAVVSFDNTFLEKKKIEVLEKLKEMSAKGTIHGISQYESPKEVYMVSPESLPKTSTGKIQRVVIKEYVARMSVPIAKTQTHTFRQITPFDEAYIKTLVDIHNMRWGTHLSISLETATEAVRNGIVIGSIHKDKNNLDGSIFVEQISKKDLDLNVPYTQSYNDVTDGLTLKKHSETADALLLVSVSTAGKLHVIDVSKQDSTYQTLLQKAESTVDEYIRNGHDPVLSFHMKKKGGLSKGASFVRVLKDARPDDVESLGYNVLLVYPEISESVAISEDESLGTQLVESAFIYAKTNKIKHVFAYSRPSGFYAYLYKKHISQ